MAQFHSHQNINIAYRPTLPRYFWSSASLLTMGLTREIPEHASGRTFMAGNSNKNTRSSKHHGPCNSTYEIHANFDLQTWRQACLAIPIASMRPAREQQVASSKPLPAGLLKGHNRLSLWDFESKLPRISCVGSKLTFPTAYHIYDHHSSVLNVRTT